MPTDFQQLPKIELHSHLDCSLSYNAVKQLVGNITEEEYLRQYVAPARCESLADYLDHTRNSVLLLQSERALQIAVRDLFEQLRLDHVIYIEIRFAPLLHIEQGLRPEQVVETVAAACDEASATTGIESRLILCTLRHFPAEKSMQTVQLIQAFQGTRVAAFDMAGDEAGYAEDEHEPAFRFAIEHGIPRTTHAGEALGAESVWRSLEKFQPSRIGHGIHSIEDPRLVEHLRERQIHLEICPQCNIQTRAVPSLREHPVDRLYNEGVSIGISTDTRGITGTNLTAEYQGLAETFGWDAGHFLACNLNALQASFLPAGEKGELKDKLISGYAVP